MPVDVFGLKRIIFKYFVDNLKQNNPFGNFSCIDQTKDSFKIALIDSMVLKYNVQSKNWYVK